MPYRRSYKSRGRKRKAGGRNFLNRKYSIAQIASKAMSGVRKIRRLINVEKKYVDAANTDVISSTGNMFGGYPIVGFISQGDANTQRDGNSVLGQSIYIQHQFKQHTSATHTFVRVIVFVDKQQVADTAPTSTMVLASDDVESMYNYENKTRFEILSDKRWTFSTGSRAAVLTHYTIPYNRHVRWNGTSATDYQKGQVWMLLISTEATNTVTADTRVRFTFTDN